MRIEGLMAVRIDSRRDSLPLQGSNVGGRIGEVEGWLNRARYSQIVGRRV